MGVESNQTIDTAMSEEYTTLIEQLDFPEGPAFNQHGALWCVEWKGGDLIRYNGDSTVRIDSEGGGPTGLAFDWKNRGWLCDPVKNELRIMSPSESELKVEAATFQGEPLAEPNDLAFGPKGNLVFTCPGENPHETTGYVCCRRPDGTLTKVGDELQFPNGLAFLNEGQELVVAETEAERLMKGQWDPEQATWKDPKPFADVGPGGPDGMALSADGSLLVAVYGSGFIKEITPTGEIAERHEAPGSNPTNAAFDPAGELGLVVTEAETGTLVSYPAIGDGAPLFDGRPE